MESAKGVQKKLTVTIMDSCPSCKGSGGAPGSRIEKCRQCHGTGMETVSTGPFVMRSTCRVCKGKGGINPNPCQECQGEGETRQRRQVTVPVPPGIQNGQTVKMAVGKTDIYITFRVGKSDYFRRDGFDVHTEAKISISQAILGGSIRIQGIHEDLNVEIAPGTGSHVQLRLRGKGIQNNSRFGDHYVHVKVEVPKNFTDPRRRLLIQAYAELETETPGTVNGFGLDKDGNKVVLDDEEGQVKETLKAIEAIVSEKTEKNSCS